MSISVNDADIAFLQYATACIEYKKKNSIYKSSKILNDN